MTNMASKLNSHNKHILNSEVTENERLCNCRNKPSCPFSGNCLKKNIVYKANVSNPTDPNKIKSYFGICETTFKLRFANHKKSFSHEKHEKDTELSKYVWEMRRNNIEPIITWSIAKETTGYNAINKTCNLCLSEKFLILNFKDKPNLLNKRNEIVSKCRHQTKFTLSSC